ncbi:MAG: carboxypeptidase regulatory-like domain-containing protein [Armatimonadetes bacterium]|nr:carboxypeptidase regulatory-like domain-containing protein [Armatimonadota bacterium]
MKKQQQQRVLACAGIILVAMLTGGISGCTVLDAEPTDSCVVSGIVCDSLGLGIPNAIVEVAKLSNTIVAVDTSDSDGQFSFPERFSNPEQLVIRVHHPEFNPFSQNVAEAIHSSAVSPRLRLLLQSGQRGCVRIPIEVVYQKQSGNIYDLVIGAEVRLFSQGKFRSKAISDSSGAYFTSLPVGAFRIEITKPDFRLGSEDFVLTECGSYPITFRMYPE